MFLCFDDCEFPSKIYDNSHFLSKNNLTELIDPSMLFSRRKSRQKPITNHFGETVEDRRMEFLKMLSFLSLK